MGDEDNLRARRKALLYTFITFAILMTATQWYATQSVAADCNYNPVLGWGRTIGEYHIYAPWAYYLWSNNEILQEKIPHILDNYSYYRDRKSTRLNSSHRSRSRMPSSA